MHEGKTLLYRAARKIPRDIHERARDVTRSFAGTEGFEQSRRERKKVEMRLAHLKRILKLGRHRLRGPRGAQDEFVLAAIAQNLWWLATLVARPPPAQVLCIALRWNCINSARAGGSKPFAFSEMADRPSAAADFCNKICQEKTPPERIYSMLSTNGVMSAKPASNN